MTGSNNNLGFSSSFLDQANSLLTRHCEKLGLQDNILHKHYSLFEEYQKKLADVLYHQHQKKVILEHEKNILTSEFIEKILQKQAKELAAKWMDDTDLRALNFIDLEQLILEYLKPQQQYSTEKLDLLFKIFQTKKHLHLEMPPNQYSLDCVSARKHLESITDKQIEMQKQMVERIFKSIEHSDMLLEDRKIESKKDLFFIRLENMIKDPQTENTKQIDPTIKEKQNLHIKIIKDESELMHSLANMADKTLRNELQIRYTLINYLPEECNLLFLKYQKSLIKNLYEQSLLNNRHRPKIGWIPYLAIGKDKNIYDARLDKLQKDRTILIEDFKQQYGTAFATSLVNKFIEMNNITSPDEQERIKEFICNKILPMQKYLSAKVHLAFRMYTKPEYLFGKKINMDFIEEDIKLINNQTITSFMKKAKKILKSIPGNYMLPEQTKNQLIQELFFILCEQDIQIKNNKTIDFQAILAINMKEIYLAIDNAAKNYLIPEEQHTRIKQHMLLNLSAQELNLTPLEQAIKNAIIKFENITKGSGSLKECSNFKDRKNEFINKLTLLEEKQQQINNIQKLSGKILQISKLQSLKDTEEKYLIEINQAIVDAFRENNIVQQEFVKQKQLLQTESIVSNNTELKRTLENNLLNAIANDQANKERIDIKKIPIVTIEQASRQIETAKILCNIAAFKCMSTPDQLEEINKLNNAIADMAKKELSRYEQQQQLKELIYCIMNKSNIADLAKKELDIKPNGKLKQAMDALSNFISHPTTQATVTAAIVGWVLGTAVTNMPSSGSLFNKILSFTMPYMPATISNYLQGYLGANVTINATNIGLLTAAAAAVLGYKYNSIRHVLYPLNYIAKEISDIYNNTKMHSYPNRIFRAGLMLAAGISTGAATIGILWYTAIPISAPIIASTAIVGSLLTTITVAASAKLGKVIFNSIIKNTSQKKPTREAITLFGNNEDRALKIIVFLNEKIAKIEKILESLTNISHAEKTSLEKCQNDLTETLQLIQMGNIAYKDKWWQGDQGLRKDLYELEEHIYQTKIKNIDPNYIANSLLNIFTTKVSNLAQQPNQVQPEENQETRERKELFIMNTKNAAIDFNKEMEQLIHINYIMNYQDDLPMETQEKLLKLSELNKPSTLAIGSIDTTTNSSIIHSPPKLQTATTFPKNSILNSLKMQPNPKLRMPLGSYIMKNTTKSNIPDKKQNN